MRTLIIQTSFIGDMVLTTPLLTYLAKTDEVHVVGTPASTGLLANHPAAHKIMIYDKRGADRGVGGFLRLANTLRRERYDRAFMAQGSTRSGALALAAGIGTRIGFDTSAGRAFYTQRIPYMEAEHHSLRLLRLAGAAEGLRPSLFPGPAERAAVDALLGARSTDRLIGLAPGSVWATKRWPGYEMLARALAKRAVLVVIGSSDDHELAAEIVNAAGPRAAIDATGRLSLLASAELIRRCAVLITNDSAPQHLASAMNTPTVTLFGPTVPEFGFGPLAERSATVGLDSLACRPCDRHGPVACPLKHWKCMRDVGVERVLAAIDSLS